MIFQIVEGLGVLAELAALFIVLLGVMWLIYAGYEANRRKSWKKLTGIDDWDFDVTKFLKLISFLGFFLGIFCIIVGTGSLILDLPPSKAYAAEVGNQRSLFTAIFLIVLGILTFMKPLNDIPISSIIGLLAASAVCILIAVLIPDSAVKFIGGLIDIDPKWLLIIIFIVIFSVVGITVKFYTAGLMFVSKIISWPPFAFIIAVFCFIQGGALLVMGVSIL
ncbi:MAG: hypothetical protein EU548_07145 [Promethearchaeota archaeon]|nr:MAG: hypothetical protein EU548_07145 [Candidatus Lokiarchaeota archaeon]